MPSGIDDLTVIMKQDQLTPDLEDLLIRELVIALHPDEIHITHDYALLMVVGEGMLNRTGLMSKATDAWRVKTSNWSWSIKVPQKFP